MSDYKEDTVGWFLNRLKEPLRSDALASMKEFNPDQLSLTCAGYANALSRVTLFDPDPLWVGAFWYFNGATEGMGGFSEQEQRGWDMAKECAPEPETVVFSENPLAFTHSGPFTYTVSVSKELFRQCWDSALTLGTDFEAWYDRNVANPPKSANGGE